MAFLFKLAAKSLLLVILSCQFGLQCIFVVIQTLMELLRAALYLHLVSRSAIWLISILSLPMRAFVAMYKDKMVFFPALSLSQQPFVSCGAVIKVRTATLQLHKKLHQVRNELDDVLWDRKELEKQLHMAIKERRMMDAMFTELQNKHEDAIVQIEFLNGEVRDLKREIRRVKGLEGKSLWDDKGEDNEEKCSYTNTNVNTRTSLPSRYENISHNTSPEIVRNHDMNELMKNQPKIKWPMEQQVAKQRDLALSQSLFSAILALLVGMIVWEAQDPCMPLILALFMVVASSLWRVVKFFSTIQRKPTNDAVALLSFNWFMLGILMYPTLPMFVKCIESFCFKVPGMNVYLAYLT